MEGDLTQGPVHVTVLKDTVGLDVKVSFSIQNRLVGYHWRYGPGKVHTSCVEILCYSKYSGTCLIGSLYLASTSLKQPASPDPNSTKTLQSVYLFRVAIVSENWPTGGCFRQVSLTVFRIPPNLCM